MICRTNRADLARAKSSTPIRPDHSKPWSRWRKAQLDKDAVRIQIDDAISKVLSLPSLTPVRELLAREPGLSAVEINPRHGELEEAEAEPEQAVLL
jgi:hypothetical protein